MSLFTVEKPYSPGTVFCPRCKRVQFVKLVRRDSGHDIYDCTECGPVLQKRKPE